MDDHAPCPRCGYENARCACPKNVPNPSQFSEAERRALAESVRRAVKDIEARKAAAKTAEKATRTAARKH